MFPGLIQFSLSKEAKTLELLFTPLHNILSLQLFRICGVVHWRTKSRQIHLKPETELESCQKYIYIL